MPCSSALRCALMQLLKHGILPVLAGSLLGCPYHEGLYPLQTLPASELGTDHLDLRAKVELQYKPTKGWDLVLDVHLHAHEGVRPLVDMSRTMWRSDGVRWTTCSLPSYVDASDLRLRLYEEEAIHLVLRCVHIQRPTQKLEVRLPVSGAGGKGYFDLVFSGVDNAKDASAWELD